MSNVLIQSEEQTELKLKDTFDFILGGKAIITIKNIVTGNRFTYRIKKSKKRKPTDANVWFVSVLTGSQNDSDYSYIGYIKYVNRVLTFIAGNRHINEGAQSVQAFSAIFYRLRIQQGLANVRFYHSNKCARCGRTLTVPESIESGFGPECIHLKKNY